MSAVVLVELPRLEQGERLEPGAISILRAVRPPRRRAARRLARVAEAVVIKRRRALHLEVAVEVAVRTWVTLPAVRGRTVE
jgi:hypothetical protein